MTAALCQKLAQFVLWAALLASVVTDLRSRLILNAVTFPALALIFALLGVAGGWPLLRGALLGCAACALPFFLAALPGWIGMGDVKLLAVAGAAAGWPGALAILLFVGAAGGVQAALQILWARMLRKAPPRRVPYACAIAAGTVAAFLFGERLL